MPIYSFYCTKCKKVVTDLYNKNELPPFCKECNMEMIKKIDSPSNIVFKDGKSGWAKNLYGDIKK